MPCHRSRTILGALLFPALLWAKAYEVPAGADVGVFFATLPKDVTLITFSAANHYKSQGDIVLPDAPMLTIDGNGCKLALGAGSNGFTRKIADQKDAMQRISCRYFIRNITIQGGKRAIDLQATYGSAITDIGTASQTETAIDLRFCLMCRVQNAMVTDPRGQGIVVRQGDWPGASATNSQSNSTVLEQCRIYCAKSTTNAFTVLNSGGVRMQDCISEGADADRDLFLSASSDEAKTAGNPVVKSFTLDNFHVEHAARKQCIYINMPPKAAVHLSNLYINHPQSQPVIYYMTGQLSLTDIGWWNQDLLIATPFPAPRINVDRCHSDLNAGPKGGPVSPKAGVFRYVGTITDAVKGLSQAYIRIMNPSM
ncbi:MAG: hypothetical protein QM724_03310 [Flavobacteriales bacterium]